MRVTDSLVFDSAIRDSAQARERLETAQRVAATGQKVVHPSDDPAAAGQLAVLSLSGARLRALSSATGQAASELQAADSALSGVANVLTRAQQLAVQFANATYSAEQRAVGAGEVTGLLAQVIQAGNTKFGGRFLFGGSADSSAPFAADGSYLGSDVARQVEVAPGVLQTASVDAHAALRGTGGGTDVVGTLQALQAALAANDPAAVRATLDGLVNSVSQVATARAQAGVAMDAFDAAGTTAQAVLQQETARSSALGDADIVTASIQLTQAQQGLQAALAAAAQGFKLSLLNYLP